jgi:hypothetical protein
MLRFPNGQNDDGVDVLSLYGRGLDKILAGRKPDIPPPKLVVNTQMPTIDDVVKRHLERKKRDRDND